VEPSRVLTVDEIRDGLAAALDWRRFMIWHGVKLASFMAGCGLLLVGAAYLTGAPMSLWMLLLPVVLAAIVLPHPLREVRHFSRMAEEFRVSESRALAGNVVRAQDVPTLGRRSAA